MAGFEKYEETVIYCDSSVGAMLDIVTGKWNPFRFFDNGNIDLEEIEFDTFIEAYQFALETFT